MKSLEIRKTSDLIDLSDFTVNEDIEFSIKLKLHDDNLNYPIKIIHSKPGLSSNINVKIALFGKSNLKMPVEIWVREGAKNTSTSFKATVYLMNEKAKAEVTPGLFIHEKDIQSAGHGVIIKNIKEKDTFYLQSRGLEQEIAKEMIIGI